MIIRNMLDYHEKKSPSVPVDRKSATIPDQSMTIREIYDRFSRGLPVSGQKVPQYYGDEEVPVNSKEPITQIEISRRVKEELEEIKQRVKKDVDEQKETIRKQKESQQKQQDETTKEDVIKKEEDVK